MIVCFWTFQGRMALCEVPANMVISWHDVGRISSDFDCGMIYVGF